MSPWSRLGAVPRPDGSVDFRVWAPRARNVAVRVDGRDHELAAADDGLFEGAVKAAPGADYVYVLDRSEERPDPCSRFQPAGIRGQSRVVDPSRFQWTDDDWPGLALDELAIYELHVGAFSPAGTFAGVAERLPELRELGVTAVELMPIGTFPGNRNWGYDGIYGYAPHPAYGGPEGLAALVDAAHREGLGVILDVVYNHLGPGCEAITAFAPYFTERHSTFWGEALDYGRRGVREWAIQNAELWIRDYHVDGLRLDATHAIFDDSEPHVLAELADRVRKANPRALVTAEMETGDLRPIEEWDHDAQWADELHHVLHVLLTGEREGWYADYRPSVGELGRHLLREPPQRLVVCSQNHDQVGNRALGDRPGPDELRLRAATVLLAPQTPLLFMGEEYGERRPFQFFTDHVDPFIAEATREGRRREFEAFSEFSGQDVPDPQDPVTFERWKLDPSAGDPELLAFYRQLLALRRELPREAAVAADEHARIVRVRRGHVEAVLDFAARKVGMKESRRAGANSSAMMKEFREFLLRGNLVDTAVGIVIGLAFAAVITALVSGLITPLIAAIFGEPSFGDLSFTVNESEFLYGAFLNTLITFVLVALVLFFLVVKPVNAMMARRKAETPIDEETVKCPHCLSDIPAAARRCAFCTQEVAA